MKRPRNPVIETVNRAETYSNRVVFLRKYDSEFQTVTIKGGYDWKNLYR